MDLYLTLKKCYKQGIEPFMLYAMMRDACGGDLKLKSQVDYFYTLYKEQNIIEKVFSCSKDEFDLLIKQYDKKFISVLIAIARFQHPEWGLEDKVASQKDKKVKVQKVTQTPCPTNKAPINKPVQNKQVFFQKVNVQNGNAQKFHAQKVHAQNANVVMQKPAKAKKQLIKPYASKKEVKITSYLSDVDIVTGLGAVDFEIKVVNNGVWSTLKSGIIRRKNCTYINVEKVIADKIEIIIPKDKYSLLEVNKAHGDLNVTDLNDCFAISQINLTSGKLNCCVSSTIIDINAIAGKVFLDHKVLRDGKVRITNGVGGVSALILNAERALFKLLSGCGKVDNNFTQGTNKGNEIEVNIKSKYGDIKVY